MTEREEIIILKKGLKLAESILKYEQDRNKKLVASNRELTKQLSLNSVGCSYSLQEVREIALELTNASMYGHSHKLTRFELKDKLSEIKTKHGLDYKEGIDYVLE